MIATENPAPLRMIRLNRRSGLNSYSLKERFAELCKKHSIALSMITAVAEDAWTEEKDSRRCDLIDKSLQATLSASEELELSKLQRQAEAHFDEVSPPPIDGALKLHKELIAIKESLDE